VFCLCSETTTVRVSVSVPTSLLEALPVLVERVRVLTYGVLTTVVGDKRKYSVCTGTVGYIEVNSVAVSATGTENAEDQMPSMTIMMTLRK
jgi:hypothetical protein